MLAAISAMGASQSAARALRYARPVVAAAPLVVVSVRSSPWRCDGPMPAHPQATPEATELPSMLAKQQRVLAPPPQFKECLVPEGAVRNIVLLGLTGAGKSTLANQIAGTKAFKSGDSMKSETQEVQCHKFQYMGESYRVIDTPGFFDTTMSHEQVANALDQFANVAKEGLVAVLVVVKHGRFTEENEAVIKFVEAVLGSTAVAKYGMLVITHTRKGSDKLQEELASLPEGNLGRNMASKVDHRVLGVDSSFWRLPPYKTQNDIMGQVEDMLRNNKLTAIDCDVMNWGARIKEQLTLEFEMQTSGLRQQIADNQRTYEENKKLMQESHENDRAEIMKEQQRLQNENDKIQWQLQNTQERFLEMKQQMRTQQNELESTRSSVQQLNQQVASKDSHLEKLTSELDSTRSSVQQLNKQVASKDAYVDKLASELDSTMSSVQRLNQQKWQARMLT